MANIQSKLDIHHWMFGVGYYQPKLDIRNWTFDVGSCLLKLDVHHWTFDVGNFFLHHIKTTTNAEHSIPNIQFKYLLLCRRIERLGVAITLVEHSRKEVRILIICLRDVF